MPETRGFPLPVWVATVQVSNPALSPLADSSGLPKMAPFSYLQHMTHGAWFAFALLGTFLITSASVNGRTFKDQNGRTIEAELVSKNGTQATIRRSDGKEFSIPISSLSPEDQTYIGDWQPKGEATPTPDPRVQPGAIVTLAFPDLPADQNGEPASCQIRIPDNFEARKPVPLLVWINGGKGSNAPGGGLPMIDPANFAVAALPYPGNNPTPRDALTEGKIGAIFDYHKPMLEEIRKLLPNLDERIRIVAGFSNGAHLIGTAIETGLPEFVGFFNAFVIIEGGARSSSAETRLRGKYAYLAWGTDAAKRGSKDYMQAMVGGAHEAKLETTTSEMEGEGHAFPEPEKAKVKTWIETIVIPGLTAAR